MTTHIGGSGFKQFRVRLWKVFLPVALFVVGLVGFFSGQQRSGQFDGSASPGTIGTLVQNILHIPHLLIDYSAGFIGLNWVDTVMPPLVWVPVTLVSLGAVFVGLRKMDFRKGLVLGGALLVFIAMPLYVLQKGGYLVGDMVQSRYVVPMVPIIVALALARPKDGGAARLSAGQTTVAYVGLVLAQSVALHVQIRRFVTGLDVTALNLDHIAEWWHAGPSPMATWAIGSVGFAALAAALFVVRGGRSRRDRADQVVADSAA